MTDIIPHRTFYAAALLAASILGPFAPARADDIYAGRAIHERNYAVAERILKPVSAEDSADPARLINMATVLLATQRYGAADGLLRRVRLLPDEALLLDDRTSVSSHVLAATMLFRLQTAREEARRTDQRRS